MTGIPQLRKISASFQILKPNFTESRRWLFVELSCVTKPYPVVFCIVLLSLLQVLSYAYQNTLRACQVQLLKSFVVNRLGLQRLDLSGG